MPTWGNDDLDEGGFDEVGEKFETTQTEETQTPLGDNSGDSVSGTGGGTSTPREENQNDIIRQEIIDPEDPTNTFGNEDDIINTTPRGPAPEPVPEDLPETTTSPKNELVVEPKYPINPDIIPPAPIPTEITPETIGTGLTTTTSTTTTSTSSSIQYFSKDEHETVRFDVRIEIQPHVTIPIKSLLQSSLEPVLRRQFRNYYDDLRVGKTLLNVRDDRQIPIINWKVADSNTTDYPEVAIKLSEPLDTRKYPLDTSVFISREMLDSVVDRMRFIPYSELLIPQLRPSRDDQKKLGSSTSITATLTELIPNIAGGTGTLGSGSSYVNYISNNILESYYSRNKGITRINVDYSDFNKFVTFGSAQKRLDVFKGKLETIQELIRIAPIYVENLNISGSSSDSGSYETVFGTLEIDINGNATLSQTGSSAVYDFLYNATPANKSLVEDFINTSINTSIKIQDLIRGLDDYENTLWFTEGIQYTASSEEYYIPEQTEYFDLTYPKILGIPLATTHNSGIDWYTSMSAIATEYDDINPSTLSNNVPQYLADDNQSIDFLTFVDMVGHHFDNLKISISNLKNLSSRYPKVDEEISGDMAKRVLDSFGISAPSIDSAEKLIRYVTGNNDNDPYEDIANEYYKRYLHAMPFLLRTKGSKQTIKSLLNVFGINPDIITIREGISNRYTSLEGRTISTTEQDFSLDLNSGSFIAVPFGASLRSPQTIQARFALVDDRTQPVFRFDNDYTIQATFHPDGLTNTYYANTGRIDLLSGSTTLVTSSYFDLFDKEFTSIQLKYDVGGAILDVRKIEEGDTTFVESIQETQMSMSADWSSLNTLHIGIPPASSSGATDYTLASLDEFRMWGQPIEEGKFIEFAENPGVYAGNEYTSSLEDLYVRLSFNLPIDLANTGSVPNDSPYLSITDALDLTNIPVGGFTAEAPFTYNTTRYLRTVLQTSYNISADSETTDMIRIAPDAPTITSLSSTRVNTPEIEKFFSSSVGTNYLDLSVSPVDAVDREIVRAFGNINLGEYLGDPTDTNLDEYEGLEDLEDVFVRELAPTIDYNNFIRFFDKFLHLFYESVEQYLPARANVRKGIVIRPHVLDRTKVNNRENIKFSGENSRRTLDNDFDVIRSYDFSMSRAPTEEILSEHVFGLFNNNDTSYQLDYWGAEVDVSDLNSLNARYQYLEGEYRNIFGQDMISSELNSDLEAILTRTYTENVTGQVQTNINGIGACCDLWSIVPGDRNRYVNPYVTYFSNGTGQYYVDRRRDVYITSSMMVENSGPNYQGNWVSGNSYRRGDVVLQPEGTLGSANEPLTRNGKLFYFTNAGLSENSSVQSFQPPQLDTNFQPVPEKSEIYQKLIRATYVTGSAGASSESFSVLEDLTASYYRLAKEYENCHFESCRDKTLGGLRRTYLGTLNTIAGTIDGGPPFEYFEVDSNQLTVGSPEPCPECD